MWIRDLGYYHLQVPSAPPFHRPRSPPHPPHLRFFTRHFLHVGVNTVRAQ